MKMHYLLLPLSLILCLTMARGQVSQLNIDPNSGCNFDGAESQEGPVYGFDSSKEAEETVSEILRQVGLPQNFMIHATNVPNAQAHVSGGERYILYSQRFMDDIYNHTGDYWSKIAVLAHEIAHHLLGHTLKDDGSRPVKELEADRWSGFVLYKMGASLAQAQLAVMSLASEGGSATHPGKDIRLEAIAVGYNEARELDTENNPSGAKETEPETQPTNETATQEQSEKEPSVPATTRTRQPVKKSVELGGKTYKVVTINGLTWMAENLDYTVRGSWCYDDNSRYCGGYGRLYQHAAAERACKILGWRLPTLKEAKDLARKYGGYWSRSEIGENLDGAFQALTSGGKSGFNAQMGGVNGGSRGYYGLKKYGYFWTSKTQEEKYAWTYWFHPERKRVQIYYNPKEWGVSCRCVKDN